MSTDENKEVERRIIEEVGNKRNLSVVDEIIDTNWVFHGPGGQEMKGRESFKQSFNIMLTAFPDFQVAIEDMVAEGDKVATRYTFRGTQRSDFMGIAPTGKKVECTGIVITRIAGGKEVELWEMPDQFGMMQQLGVEYP